LYLYFHGFASGANSLKARYFQKNLSAAGCLIALPDFNEGGFEHFTIGRQLQQARDRLPANGPATLIGSSLGGWAALLLAQQSPQVERLVLLAPAWGFPGRWLDKIGSEALQRWQQQSTWPVYHYAAQRELPLAYNFVTEAQQYRQVSLERELPTLILHGGRDEVVPIDGSRQYAAQHPATQLIELDSDHSLANVLPQLWQATADFCQISSPLPKADHPS
jgi:uncharacterized protein